MHAEADAWGREPRARTPFRAKDLGTLLRSGAKEWIEDKAPRLAAALAYYSVFSLAPLIVIAVSVAGLVFDDAASRARVVGTVAGFMGAAGAEVVEGILEAADKPRTGIAATIAGIAVLLFGALGVFGQLKDSLNTIWEVAPDPRLPFKRKLLLGLRRKFLSFAALLGTGFLLLVSLLASAALSALTSRFLGGKALVAEVVNFALTLLVATALFALIFKLLPDVRMAWKDTFVGAAATALLFVIGKTLIGLYLGRGAVGSAYGAAGSVVVVLVWVYYSSLVLFYGAEVTQIYANRHGSNVTLRRGAVPLTTEVALTQDEPWNEDRKNSRGEGRAV